MKPQILIADDHPLFRQALVDIVIPILPEHEIVEAINYSQATQLISEHSFKLAFIDLHMPDTNGLADLAMLKKLSPQTPIVVVSAHEGNDVISTCLNFGASGYIVKSSSKKEIHDGILRILAGEVSVPTFFNPQHNESELSAEAINSLTPSQLRIFLEIGKGKLNKQIAYDLGISEATVKAHITSVFRKLNISNRTQAVIFAKEHATNLSSAP